MPYPVSCEVDYAERHSRLTTFFRLILMIPIAIWWYIYGIIAYLATIIAWFVIVITGQFPAGLYNFIAGFVRLTATTTSYGALLVDPYPSFSASGDPSYLLEIAAFAAWFVIIITGKLPRGLFDVMVLAVSYTVRSDAYLFLLTETYPPFQDEHTRSTGLADHSFQGSSTGF